MKKEFKRIRGVSKKIVGRDYFKKIKKIDDHKERTESLKYLVASKLQLRLLDLESKVGNIKKKEAWVIESKIKRLASKIKIFESTHAKKDYLTVEKLINEIEGEIQEHV